MFNNQFLFLIALSSYLVFTSAGCKKDKPTTPSSGNPIQICTSSADSENSNYFNENTTLSDHNRDGDGVDYIIGCGVTINKNITIEAGVTIWMEQDAYILVDDNGQIQANGSASDPILIEGSNQIARWEGLEFRTGQNVLEHVTINNAGHGSKATTVHVSSFDADLTMRNCSLDKGNGYGLWVEWPNSELIFSGNIIHNHKKAPVYITANHVHQLDKLSSFYSSTENFIQVSVSQVDNSVTWANLELPYQIIGLVPQTRWIYPADNKTLTIEAGTSLKFGEDTGIESNKGSLKIEGTATNPISLRGKTITKGSWYGVYIGGSLTSTISHAVIDGAGGYAGGSSYPASANVMVESNATLNISNSSIKNSKTCGIGTQTGSTINSSDLTFEGNTDGNECTK